ncbi:hypothetical protein EZY14_000330 [Kordia sp. TARA_039_SRF]|nr:hypothetical protein EZY14_000330 [Kordia sp. TARA_039_SRF]
MKKSYRYLIFFGSLVLFVVFLFFIHPYIVMNVGGVGLAGIIEIILLVFVLTILVFTLSPSHKD